MRLHGYVLLLTIILSGCANEAAHAPPAAPSTERLPPEVTDTPEAAMSAKPQTPRPR